MGKGTGKGMGKGAGRGGAPLVVSAYSVRMSDLEAVGYIFVYVVVGVIFYFVVEGWSVRDAAYFSFVTSTTIGYGDICPSTAMSKLFTVVYGFVGITVISNAINIIAEKMMEMRENANSKAMAADMAENERRLKKMMEDGTPIDSEPPLPSKTINEKYAEAMYPLASMMVVGVIFGFFLEFPIPESIYFAFATCTTIGYGDFSPLGSDQAYWGCWLGCLYMPISIVAITKTLGDVADIALQENIKNKKFDLMGLLKADDDGTITETEFLCNLLVEYELVDEGVLDALKKQFKFLDKDGSGVLDEKDLAIINAKLNKNEDDVVTVDTALLSKGAVTSDALAA